VHCHGAALPDSVPVAHWHGVLGMGTWQYGTGMVQLDVWCGSAALPRAVTSCHVPLWHCHKIDRAIVALELNTLCQQPTDLSTMLLAIACPVQHAAGCSTARRVTSRLPHGACCIMLADGRTRQLAASRL
jgi:hypothetical protein